MRDPYEVLGLSPGAPDEEVKRAFRQLAKQLHPDLHPNDPSADLRFREVMNAYQALSNSPPLEVQDVEVVGRPVKRRGPHAKATAIAAFLFTVSSVGVGALWQELSEGRLPDPEGPALPPPIEEQALPVPRSGERPEVTDASAKPSHAEPAAPDPSPDASSASGQAAARAASVQPAPGEVASQSEVESRRGSPETAPSSTSNERPPDIPATTAADPPPAAPAQDRASKGLTPPGSVKALTWTGWRNARFGFSLAYPAEIFVADSAEAGEGATFRSRDGRARLVVSALVNASGTTLAAHRRSLMDGPYRTAVFDYTPRRAYWFVLSGVLGEEIFYERVTFSCDRRMLHAWKLVYPLAERALYDRIVEEVHRRYRHSNGAGGRCGETGEQTSRAFRSDSPEVVTP
jgi:DnaJ-like protein